MAVLVWAHVFGPRGEHPGVGSQSRGRRAFPVAFRAQLHIDQETESHLLPFTEPGSVRRNPICSSLHALWRREQKRARRRCCLERILTADPALLSTCLGSGERVGPPCLLQKLVNYAQLRK